MEEPEEPRLDFNNTELAFSHKSDRELRKTYWLFKFMNKPNLVSLGNFLGNFAARFPLHLFDPLIKETIFYQFCGGTTLLECQKVVDRLNAKNALTILDFGVEAKENEEDFDRTLSENLKAIEFAASNPNVPGISTKLTGYVPFAVLEKIHAGDALSNHDEIAWERLEERFLSLCEKANELGVALFIDAEESWIQDPIDRLVDKYMAIYNRERPIIYNTFQLYRKGKLNYLQSSYEEARSKGFILGAKLVRGAYIEKERNRAKELAYDDPIMPDKSATDRQYDDAVRFCLEHHDQISICNSSHNIASTALQAELMDQMNIPRDHPHLNFCQLLGMSDNLTFNLSERGYCVAKYVPYGPVKEIIPYLTRRAKENTSITGDMSRELGLLHKEMIRRGLLNN